MSKSDDILKQIKALIEEVAVLQPDAAQTIPPGELMRKYETWYTRALAVVGTVTPDRLDDFKQAYKLPNRKAIGVDTYTISDYLAGMSLSRGGQTLFNPTSVFSVKLGTQISILLAAMRAAPSALTRIKSELEAELFDRDIDGAKELAKAGFGRSAGVIAGVVLERHLKTVAATHRVTISKRNATIGDINDPLKNAGVYDIPTWRLIQRLADIRNLCGHDRDREPTKDEVQDLINGADKVIKEVF